ncbi:MAG: hypothetical protein ACI9OE_002796 [Mariniflexile sp.]|jgi:hypothetical protein
MHLKFNYLITIIKSATFFIKNFFIIKSYDIVFYYPAHFNRGKAEKNQFFETFYKICKDNKLTYIVFEEPDYSKGIKKNLNNVPFDFIFWLIIILRKIVPLKLFKTFQHREWFIAKLIKPFFFRLFKFNNFVVLSNSMLGFFRGLNVNAQLFDYQHGLIFSNHKGYVTNKTPSEHILVNNASLMVYGSGFKNILVNATIDEFYSQNVFLIGSSNSLTQKRKERKKNEILFSLQFADVNEEFERQTLELVNRIVRSIGPLLLKSNISLVFKHHPRYANHLDFSKLHELSFIKFHPGDLSSAFDNCFLHMTMHSTVTFEASSQAIPTILIKNDILNPNFFESDYKYPIKNSDVTEISGLIESYIDSDELYNKDANAVLDWYKDFYQSIDEDLFVRLMRRRT